MNVDLSKVKRLEFEDYGVTYGGPSFYKWHVYSAGNKTRLAWNMDSIEEALTRLEEVRQEYRAMTEGK